jgi:hypothetical protein
LLAPEFKTELRVRRVSDGDRLVASASPVQHEKAIY